jgi:hypothetical protein
VPQASPAATATASTSVPTESLDGGLHIQSSSNCNKTSEVMDEETADSSLCSPQEQRLACKVDNHGTSGSHILTSVLKHGNHHHQPSGDEAHKVTFAAGAREHAVFDSIENDDQGKHHHQHQQQDESSFSSRLQKDKNRRPCSTVHNGDYSFGNDSISSTEFPISTIADLQQEQDFSEEYEKNNVDNNNNNINSGNSRSTGTDATATTLLVMEVEQTDNNGNDNNGERECDGSKINVV